MIAFIMAAAVAAGQPPDPILSEVLPATPATVGPEIRQVMPFGAPPCGTNEAAMYDRCIVWQIVPCERDTWYRKGPNDRGSYRVEPAQPIGCEDGGARHLDFQGHLAKPDHLP